jgi:hypothetical protein
MPQHWMLPKARVGLNNLFNDGIAAGWSNQDHFAGAPEQRKRHSDTERLGDFEG